MIYTTQMSWSVWCVVFIGLFFCCGTKKVHIGVLNDNPQDDSWDYLLYVCRWPGTVGYGKNLPSNVTSFTLHGIWPTRDDGSWPQYCNDSEPFKPSEISSLVGQLWAMWYDFIGNGFDFWSHEWDKHGTCAQSLPAMDSEYNYFDEAISLHEKYDPNQALVAAGISPSNSQKYTDDQVLGAIFKAFGVNATISCTNVAGLGYALDTVEFCIDTDLSEEQCPGSQSNNCTSSFYIPQISYDKAIHLY